MIRCSKRECLILMILLLIVSAAGICHAGSVTISDDSGRKITVYRPFKRIISLYGAHTENLFALGLNTEIIGVSRNEVYPPEALNKKVYSYHDGPEKYIAAQPDLVLIRPMIDRGYSRLVGQLEKTGITVVSLQPSNIPEMFEYWRLLGTLTGKQEQAEKMVAEFGTGVARIKVLTVNIKKQKTVYFEAMHRQMKTFSKDSMAVYALETAGGINIAGDAIPSRGTNIGIYGKERILAHAGKIDVFLVQNGRMNRATVDTIKNEPGFHIIKAVKNDEIYLIDEMLVSRPTMRLLDGIREIGRVLYPDVFFLEVTSSK